MSAFTHIQFAAKSDVGRKRKNNEDSFGVFPESGVFCVADGMGGGDDGEIASAAVVKEVATCAQSHVPPPNAGYFGSELVSELCTALNDASAWIFKRAKDRNLKGCGSTFVGVCLDATAPASAVALHVGDSRLYRIRGTSIHQITRDHSAAELIGAKDENSINPCFRGVILRAVGVQPSVEAEKTDLPLKEDDRIVICSDGLSKMVEDRKISAIVHASETPVEAAEALVAAANEAGGVDNVTAVVLFVGRLPPARPGVSIPHREVREPPRPRSADSGDFDTSDTDTETEFAQESDTADDVQTIDTMTTQSPQSQTTRRVPVLQVGSQEAQQSSGVSTASSAQRTRFWVLATIVSVAATAILTSLAWLFLLGNRNTDVPAKIVEHQGEALALGEANKIANVGAQRDSRQAMTVQVESIVQNVEDDLAKKTASGQDKSNGTISEPVVKSETVTNVVTVTNIVETYIKKTTALAEGQSAPTSEETMSEGVQSAAKDNWEAVILPRLVAACAPSNSEAFVKTVRRFPNKGTVETLMMRFRPICDESLPIERRRAISAAITADVQDVARELKKYSDKRIGHIDSALSDHMTRTEFREKLVAERDGLAAFAKASEKFLDADPSTPDAQTACADIILGVVKWFRQIK